jgi:hypothetical protein
MQTSLHTHYGLAAMAAVAFELIAWSLIVWLIWTLI